MPAHQEWLNDPDEVNRRINQAGSLRRLSAETGIPKTTLQRRSKAAPTTPRYATSGPEQPRITTTDTTLEVVSQKRRIVEHLEPVDLIRSVGANPDEWSWTFKRNVWEGPIGEGQVETFHQLTVYAKRITPVEHVIPARCCNQTRTPHRARKPTTTRPLLIAFPSDQHAPHTDQILHQHWLDWVAFNAPDKIIGLGDIGNLSKPSRHRQNLGHRFNDDPNECTQGAHDWWADTINAHPGNPECIQLPGNHDHRVSIAALERTPELYDLRRPGEEHPWHDLEYLYSLDKLGVRLIRTDGEYHHSELEIVPGLTVTHGSTHGPTGGAHKAVASRHEGSRIIGHDHKQALSYVVRYRNKVAHTHTAASSGTMSVRNLGYTKERPDVNQGFATVTIWPDDHHHVELARYDDRLRTLTWRDQRYEAT